MTSPFRRVAAQETHTGETVTGQWALAQGPPTGLGDTMELTNHLRARKEQPQRHLIAMRAQRGEHSLLG